MSADFISVHVFVDFIIMAKNNCIRIRIGIQFIEPRESMEKHKNKLRGP
jgi:hypothetical protein